MKIDRSFENNKIEQLETVVKVSKRSLFKTRVQEGERERRREEERKEGRQRVFFVVCMFSMRDD